MSERSRTQDMLRDMIDVLEQISNRVGISERSTGKIFVSKDGDNSDGLSWETAYVEVSTALDSLPGDPDKLTAIMIAPGTYDINAPNPDYDCSVALIGVQDGGVVLKNTMSGASSVLTMRGLTRIENLTVLPEEFVEGIHLIGTGAYGSSFIGCEFISPNTQVDVYADGATSGLFLDHVDFVHVLDCRVVGEQGTTDGLKMRACKYCYVEDFVSQYCQYGIRMTGENIMNTFIRPAVFTNLYGILIGTGAEDNIFCKAVFSRVIGDKFVDNGLRTQVGVEVSCNTVMRTFPVGAASGVTVQGAGIETYGNWTEIIGSADLTKAYKVVGVVLANEDDATAVYKIQISSLRATRNIFHEEMFTAGSKKASSTLKISGDILQADTAIEARVQSSNGGDDSIDVWIIYEEL